LGGWLALDVVLDESDPPHPDMKQTAVNASMSLSFVMILPSDKWFLLWHAHPMHNFVEALGQLRAVA
jgi:hypothetical protein